MRACVEEVGTEFLGDSWKNPGRSLLDQKPRLPHPQPIANPSALSVSQDGVKQEVRVPCKRGQPREKKARRDGEVKETTPDTRTNQDL